MAADGARRAQLVAHPDTPRADTALVAEARLDAAGLLRLEYLLDADLAHVRLPGSERRERRDGLWRSTCFEAFVGVPGLPGYYEFNFSPGGDWAAYHFEDYRQGMLAAELVAPPRLYVRTLPGQLHLEAQVQLAGLPALTAATHLRLALAAVIEDHAGALSYWALEHPAGAADFHHCGGFVLELKAP